MIWKQPTRTRKDLRLVYQSFKPFDRIFHDPPIFHLKGRTDFPTTFTLIKLSTSKRKNKQWPFKYRQCSLYINLLRTKYTKEDRGQII